MLVPDLPEVPKMDPSLFVGAAIRYSKAANTDPGEYQPALVKLGHQAVPFILEVLPQCDPRLQKFFLYVLGQMGPEAKDALPAVKNMLGDQNKEVRDAASYAVSKIER